MIKNKKKLGGILYLEWLFVLCKYLGTLSIVEGVFEIIVPLMVAVISTIIYSYNGIVAVAAKNFADILLTLDSILIGFSVMLVTLLLTSSGNTIDKLKEQKSKVKRNNQDITLFQKLHTQFVYSLIMEIILLIVIMMYNFINGIVKDGNWQNIFLVLFTYLFLNNILSIMRGVTNVYFSFYLQKNEDKK